jgi:hypothetical protein
VNGPAAFEQTFSGPPADVDSAVAALGKAGLQAQTTPCPYGTDTDESALGWVTARVEQCEEVDRQAERMAVADAAVSDLGFTRRLHGLSWPFGGGR